MIWHILIIILLTILTQVGGVAWLLAWIARPLGRFWMMFVAFYIALSVAALYTAPMAGRTPLPCLDAGPTQAAALNPLYCVMNRQYVVPEMKDHADALAAHMHDTFPGTRTRTLDGSFPFFDGFPLLPHLSHDDGQKLDLAFYYTDADGTYKLAQARWFLGYFAFETPEPGTPVSCPDNERLSMRWDLEWLQPYLRDWPLDEARTGAALRWLVDNPVGSDYRIFIEPHLALRLGVKSEHIGFQGCRAARHDDHIHLQFSP